MTLKDYATIHGTTFQPCPGFWDAARVVYVFAADCPDLWALFHLSDYRVTSAVSGPGYYLRQTFGGDA